MFGTLNGALEVRGIRLAAEDLTATVEGDNDVITFYATNDHGHELRAVPFGTGPRCSRMVSLGDQLIEYAAAPPDERPLRAKHIQQDGAKLLMDLNR